jgi:hypothetical protein
MTASTAPQPRIRIPFFWWLREARRQEQDSVEYLRSDTAYIPASTADMWRSARPRVA